jgi:prepilin signal peptidase PulO-like enzyme (type II secretory pathway)
VVIFPLWWFYNRRKKMIKLDSFLPFGPFLALGAVCYLLFFREVVDAYFSQIEILLG